MTGTFMKILSHENREIIPKESGELDTVISYDKVLIYAPINNLRYTDEEKEIKFIDLDKVISIEGK